MNSKHSVIRLSSFSPIHFLLVMYLTFITISPSYAAENETDHEALLEIKSMITQDPYGALISWNNSFHFCSWAGVTCGKRHKRVIVLELNSQRLEGSLSPHVGNLSFLRNLNLANNSFQGVIPDELGRLSKLRFLYLYLNKFSGVIPVNTSRCSNLEKLDVSYNDLAGSIPKEIGFLSKLSFLSLGHNMLTGGIPPSLGNISSMEKFSISQNPLAGNIPDSLGHWKILKEMYCSHCNLSGTIPLSFYNLSLLTTINLADNQLSGSLSPNMGAMLPRLLSLQMWGNQLTGYLPASISNCSRLWRLEMSLNKFSGKLTINFAKLRDLRFIALNHNNFGSNETDEMKFIDSLGNCTQLERLVLGNCSFQGVLPTSIGNLSNKLQNLYLYDNHLHGSIPSSIGNLGGLKMLSLVNNQFTGNIPSTIGNIQKLQSLGLYRNQLSGQIPDAIGNLSSLISLLLFSNNLEGVIPTSLGNCHSLLEISLSNNKLSGKIPQKLLQLSSLSIALDLSQNNLFGSLPTEVGYLRMLTALDLSDNNLSGNIPSTLGSCGSLSILYLKGNLFQGTIPLSLRPLKGLLELDVSRNNLSGHIPEFLGTFKLEYLNLSYNDFDGEVPVLGVFSNESAFSISGNSRICGGNVELRLPRCKTKRPTKTFPLFAIVILISSIFIGAIICLAYMWCKKKSKRHVSYSSVSDGGLKVSYGQLAKATNGFSEANLIGSGGFSSVYKGILNEYDNQFVAVKVIHLQNRGAQRSFERECEAWRSIRHRNLLRIITSCSSIDFQGNDFKALIYEFMPNGSLHDWLHSSDDKSKLNVLQIINIIIDVACALDYIHNHCIPSFVHGDLKPSNVLLDDDMVAHVGDFGLAHFLGTSSNQNNSTGIRGTIGYAAPEYGLGNEMTTSGDVYSFGILILEVMTGKTPTDNIFSDGLNLHKFASKALLDHAMDVIDVSILNAHQKYESAMKNEKTNAVKMQECIVSTLKIGVSCCMDSPQERMHIKKVINELQDILDTLQNI